MVFTMNKNNKNGLLPQALSKYLAVKMKNVPFTTSNYFTLKII
jgi:hypothetical protein